MDYVHHFKFLTYLLNPCALPTHVAEFHRVSNIVYLLDISKSANCATVSSRKYVFIYLFIYLHNLTGNSKVYNVRR
jgi:hypothetical protein